MGIYILFLQISFLSSDFKGSFSGITAFQSHLYLDLGIKVSKKFIQECFREIPEYAWSLRRRHRVKSRKYFAFGSKERCELDLAFMKNHFHGYIGFIILIDIFNRFVWVEKFKSKAKKELDKRYKKLFDRAGNDFSVCWTDGEIENNRSFFDSVGIKLMTKPKGQHCSLVESKIGQIKTLLYNAMRSKKTRDWTKILSNTVDKLNSTKNDGIGGLIPKTVQSEDMDQVIINRLKKINRWNPPNTLNEQENQLKKLLKKKSIANLKAGSYVYLDIPDDKKIEKGSSLKV